MLELAGYLSAVRAHTDEVSAAGDALALAARVLGAEAGTVVLAGVPVAATGLDPEELRLLGEAAMAGRPTPELPGPRCWPVLRAPLEVAGVRGVLAVARPVWAFSSDEAVLLDAVAAGLSLGLGSLRTEATLREAVGDATHRALHDALTGLANRSRFVDRLDHALAQRRVPGVTVAVLYVDVDDFKGVNDRFGHAVGDRLLVETAERLNAAVRTGDTVARLGGDEFGVLIENAAGAAEASAAAGRILDALHEPFRIGGVEVSGSASIGVAVLETGSCPADELLRNADVAMYRAKNSGKDRSVVFESAMYEAILDRLELETDLRRTVGSEEIDVFFQPVVGLDDGRVLGVEALARWTHPERGAVAPDTFIPLAEETGLILHLGRQVLARACRWAGEWLHAHPDNGLFVSVNLAAQQLQDPTLPDAVAKALADAGLRPEALVLEITEQVLLEETEAAFARIQELKALGVQIALDDFGTGYSSLSFLRRFPIDVLKIDRSLVHGLRADDPRSLVEAVVALGGALGMQCLAEGVEQERELRALRALGCELAQGRYFAGAMPEAALWRYLAGRRVAPSTTLPARPAV